MTLRLDWCSREAAQYAVEHWHYSGILPAGSLITIGVWEDDSFIGSVIFSRGANNRIAEPFGLEQTDVCELTRVALDEHETPVSRINSIALSLLEDKCPDLSLVVSYADLNQGHVGIIYQAGNWLYLGQSTASQVSINGTLFHARSVHSRFGTANAEKLRTMLPDSTDIHWERTPDKHKYVYPLTACPDSLRAELEDAALPYPDATATS